MSTDTAALTADQLAAALRAGAAGSLADEAAASLIINTDWLAHNDFRRYIDYTDDPHKTGGTPMARIQWAVAVAALDAGDLLNRPSSTTVLSAILRIAASFGGGIPVNLRETVTNSLVRNHVVNALTRPTGCDNDEAREDKHDDQ